MSRVGSHPIHNHLADPYVLERAFPLSVVLPVTDP